MARHPGATPPQAGRTELRWQYAWGLVRSYLEHDDRPASGLSRELRDLGLTDLELRSLLADAAARCEGTPADVRRRYERLLDEMVAQGTAR